MAMRQALCPCPSSATTSGPKWVFATRKRAKSEAIRLGLSLVGPKMADLVAQADQHAAEGPLEVYCWRGGMRSQSVAWLLQTAGHAVKRWEGGYKAYRGRVLDSWCGDHPWVVLSGLTGSGKTEILRHMAAHAEVLDLEGLAHHKGSAFGHVGEDDQPTNEQFENDGARCIQALDPQPPLGGSRMKADPLDASGCNTASLTEKRRHR